MGRLTNLKPSFSSLSSQLSFVRDEHGHSSKAEPWRGWYKLARWKKLRLRQLQDHPLCAFCERDGITRAATVCDHVEPHRGDRSAFWEGPFQSLCKPHHDGEKQASERSRPRG